METDKTLDEKFKNNDVKQKITNEYLSTIWTPNGNEISYKMKEIMIEVAPQAMINFFQQIMINQTMQLKTDLQRM